MPLSHCYGQPKIITMVRGEAEPIRDEILYDIANLEGMNLTINVPNTWPNGTLEVNVYKGLWGCG